jgi:kynurenine formamidase
MGNKTEWLQEFEQYGDQHSRQRLFIDRRINLNKDETGFTVVYIHGGGWRDYRQDYRDFNPTINVLKTDSQYKHSLAQISSFISIDYGLSPYPGQPSDDPSRNLKHPQHLEDIAKAIEWLELEKTRKYILVGHSCGATLAFQVVKSLHLRPKAIVGLAGIYDIVKFVEDERPSPELYKIYKELITGAFGESKDVWKDASPASYSLPILRETLKGVKTIIGHSKADELCKFAQSETMVDILKEADMPVTKFLKYENSGHDEMWEKGQDIAQAIICAIEALDGLKSDT